MSIIWVPFENYANIIDLTPHPEMLTPYQSFKSDFAWYTVYILSSVINALHHAMAQLLWYSTVCLFPFLTF